MIGEVVAKALLVVKGDTSHAKAAIKDLSKEEQKAAEARIKATEDATAAWERSTAKIGLAVAGIAAAVGIARAGFEAYTHHADLMANKGGANLERLKAASGGLRTETQLLETAVKGAQGRWSLTGKEMETVERLGRALVAQGKDSAKVYDQLGEAIQKGEIEPLKNLGVVYDERLAKLDKHAAFMEAAQRVSASMAGHLDREGDAARRAGVQFSDAIDSIMQEVGKLVIALTPLVQQVAKIASMTAGLVGGAIDLAKAADRATGGKLSWAVGKAAKYNPATGAYALYNMGSDALSSMNEVDLSGWDSVNVLGPNMYSRLIQQVKDQEKIEIGAHMLAQPLIGTMAMLEGVGKATDKRTAAMAKAQREYDKRMKAWKGGFQDPLIDMLGRGASGAYDAIGGFGDAMQPENRGYEEGSAVDLSVGPVNAGAFFDDVKKGKKARLEEIFGPIDEFDRYRTAWLGLEEVVTAGLEAWIDGSKSAGQAMREALHGFAKQLAGEALLQALRHGAYAIGALALGDVKSASLHGVSAAKWAGVALAAAAVGKVSAGSAGSQAGSYAAAGIGGGGPRDRAGIALTVVTGDMFAGDSPRYIARKTRRNINNARMYADYDGAGV